MNDYNVEVDHFRRVNKVRKKSNGKLYWNIQHSTPGKNEFRQTSIPFSRYGKVIGHEIGKLLRTQWGIGNLEATVESVIKNDELVQGLIFTSLPSNNTTGIKGIYYTKKTDSWYARIGSQEKETLQIASFNCSKFGDAKAKWFATEMRRRWEVDRSVTRQDLIDEIAQLCK
jgi:hypothetical protein